MRLILVVSVVCVFRFESTRDPCNQKSSGNDTNCDNPEPIAVVPPFHFIVNSLRVLFESVGLYLQLLALDETLRDLTVSLHHQLQVVNHVLFGAIELVKDRVSFISLGLIVIPVARELLKGSPQLLEESLQLAIFKTIVGHLLERRNVNPTLAGVEAVVGSTGNRATTLGHEIHWVVNCILNLTIELHQEGVRFGILDVVGC